ncbi:MAG: tetratricopeptide repeat protein [Desulfobacterales bacterium]|nr:tetratricopeptide repeat protein [Desulfobacterales bacterium]
MQKCIITIVQEHEDPDIEVKFNGLLSHRVSTSWINKIIKAASANLWRNSKLQAEELGRELFSVLNGTGGRLRLEMDRAYSKGDGLELYLDLSPSLDALPFELMFDQEGFLLLNHDHRVTIFRLVSDRGKQKKPAPEQRALRILFMACSPEGHTTLDFEKEEELILGKTEKRHLTLDVEDSGSLEGMEDMVEWAGGFDVVHISGHAGIDKKLGPVFYMEDEIGGEYKVGPKQLYDALKAFLPRILFLSECSTGKRTNGEDIPSFAEQMVSSGVDFVMGWAGPVTNEDAICMAAYLFNYLAMGKDIAESVNLARQDVQDIQDVHDTWTLFRVYSDASCASPLIASGQNKPGDKLRKTVYRTLKDSGVKVLEQGFVGRRRQIQRGVKVLRGFSKQKGLLITGAAGVGKSCLAGKLIERFEEKKLVAVHGRLETGELFQKLIELFEQYDVKSGLEAIRSDHPPEERLMALFHDAFKELPVILYLDDFEQNLERVSSGQSDADDKFVVVPEALPLVRGLLRGFPWEKVKASLVISSRYPFSLEHAGKDLPQEHLAPISLSSMRDADLKKKVKKLAFIDKSEHRELYMEAGKGNPRLLESLDKIAAEEDDEKYDPTDLKIRIQEKQADYVAKYLFALMAETEGRDFEMFLRRSAVFRRPVPGSAFVLFGTEAQLKRAAWLTLIEQETRPDGELFQVNPMIREIEWGKLPASDQKTAHYTASEWYEKEIKGADNIPYQWLHQSVYHALSAGRIRKACVHSIDLGKMMENMKLYQELADMQQGVANHVTDAVIAEAVKKKDGKVAELLNDLGQAYYILGDYKDTEKWTEKALDIDLKSFGKDHSSVAIRYNNLGEACRKLSEYNKAIDYFEKALSIKVHHSEQYEVLAAAYNNLGETYGELGDYGKANGYFEQGLDIIKKNYGEEYERVPYLYNNLGLTCYSLNKYEEAIKHFERALGIHLKNFEENHPNEANYHNSLGGTYWALGEYGEAIRYFKRALDIHMKNFGEKHPDTAIYYHNLGRAYYKNEEYEEAVENIKLAIDILGKPEHPIMKTFQNNLEKAKKFCLNPDVISHVQHV